MSNYDQNLLLAINETYKQLFAPDHYDRKRSSKKVDQLHYTIQRHLDMELSGSGFELFSKITDKSEKKVHGYYFDKKTDISVYDNRTKQMVATIEFKWLMSSVQKNTVNSITNMIGESTNIRKTGLKTYWIYCIRNVTPVYNNGGLITSTYKIDENFIDKYRSMYKDNLNSDVNLPNALCLNIIKDDVEMGKLKSKRELEVAYDQYCKEDKLNVGFDKNVELEINGLYINNYNKFIKMICEDIKNGKSK
ncbi:hypothetical protein SCLARK_001299 [Spiroplasma clarkii]|uniref:Restriction endonuclease n=1 Tax=Spiroplasma clarkii TaxID=2139 RepID=A0A1Y0L282_9MOLU|nr:hypothetical protein [Spiroplasma clarkii]ARU91835.1 hypothetical protein SCLARK_001299 [Spiroplasma clarkii]ATX71195.1 hypothetical protein SCLAR_v1c08890 [Spiroplasma clarkii]